MGVDNGEDYRAELEEAALEAAVARSLGHTRLEISTMSDLQLRRIVMSDAPATCPYTSYVDGKGWIALEPPEPPREPITLKEIEDLDEYEQEVCLQDEWVADDSESD